MELHRTASVIADRFSIPEGIFMGLIEAESGWNPQAVSRSGAVGLTQVMPATARALGYNPEELALSPVLQLEAGAKYLHEMYAMFEDWEKALAAYNAGPHNVRKYNGIPPFRKTQTYVGKIMAFAREY